MLSTSPWPSSGKERCRRVTMLCARANAVASEAAARLSDDARGGLGGDERACAPSGLLDHVEDVELLERPRRDAQPRRVRARARMLELAFAPRKSAVVEQHLRRAARSSACEAPSSGDCMGETRDGLQRARCARGPLPRRRMTRKDRAVCAARLWTHAGPRTRAELAGCERATTLTLPHAGSLCAPPHHATKLTLRLNLSGNSFGRAGKRARGLGT